MSIVELEKRNLHLLLGSPEGCDRFTITERLRVLDGDLWMHAAFVSMASEQLAVLIGCDLDECLAIADAAWLHDVGKLSVPRAILDKSSVLDEREWTEMRAHADRGANYLQSEPTLGHLAPLIRHHHERFGGGGYPAGLTGDAIPRGARIICIVDAFDAMTSKRAYRPAISFKAARCEVLRCAGTQFDPEIARIFCSGPMQWERG